MLNATQLDLLDYWAKTAEAAGHIYPAAAACEAALETAWGTSRLYVEGNNVFGEKQTRVALYPSIELPTVEYVPGKGIVDTVANWIKFPDVASSFRFRMETLTRLESVYPHYHAALLATSPAQFLTEVSQSWSTDPMRGPKCLAIFNSHVEQLDQALRA
jgi:flagellum-specific peptidoglycan hydrolase FlgJ